MDTKQCPGDVRYSFRQKRVKHTLNKQCENPKISLCLDLKRSKVVFRWSVVTLRAKRKDIN